MVLGICTVWKQRTERTFFSDRKVQGPSQDLPLPERLIVPKVPPLEEPSIHTLANRNTLHIYTLLTIEKPNDLKAHNRF